MQKSEIEPRKIAAEIIARLEAGADPVRAAGSRRYFKEQVEFYGLTTPEMRAICGEFHERIKKSWTLDEAMALCEILLPRKKMEAKAASIVLLLKFKKEFGPDTFRRIKAWLAADYCDNWAAVDILCPEGLGFLLDRNPALIKDIKTWTAHPNRWVRRASIVAFVPLARRGKYLDAAYDIGRRMFATDDDLLQKAAGWMIREAGKTDMARLEAFLLEHGPAIPRTTLRYAIERFSEVSRKRLLAVTRKAR
jgi:3-methyladenine DNA glycosylase AlkD